MTYLHRPTSPRLHPYACLLLASLLAASGCAGDDSGDSEGTTTSASASASDSEGSATEATESGTAGTESSATDGSATDGSATDGSATDASATDASATDASTTDASTTDASTTDASTTDASTTDETGVEGPSFAEIYEKVIVAQNCNSGYCHGAGAGGLLLTDEATSYASLVGVEANAPMCGSTLLVAPSSPEESVLWYRTRPAALDEGMEPCAPKMPEGSKGLEEAEGGLLLDWIEGGAPE